MSRRPKDIGTAAESAVVRTARAAGFPLAERLALAGAQGDGKTGPVRGPITYEITIDGKKHSVAVKPA